jgi:hypothetical protein
MNRNTKRRIIWAAGTALALCLCFLLCRFAFIDMHGSYQYPVLLLFVGFVVVGIAAVFDGRKIMTGTVIGYIGGFAAGIIFGIDGADQGGGATNSWWVIWTVSFVIMIIVGVIWEVTSRRMELKRYKSMDYIVTINSPIHGDMRVKVTQRDFNTVSFTLLDGISAGYGFSTTRMLYGSSTRRNKGATLPSPFSRVENYNAAKNFVEQLGPSGYLDDGP